MKNLLRCLALFLLFGHIATAQEAPARPEGRKGSMFFYWGYNRSFYSTTNLHFTGPNYDFTVYHLKGTDRPSKFGMVYFGITTFTVPQYNYRLGYYFTDRLAVSLGMDHMKYVVQQDQWTTLSGVITKAASEKYAGAYLNQPVQLTPDLLTFEHTNGFNFASLDVEYLQPLLKTWKDRIALSWNVGLGGVWVVTKTDVRVMGDGMDNDFHVAGYAMAAKTGPRIDLFKRFFLAGELKAGYASIPSVLIKNADPEIGDHNLEFLEYYIVGGVNFRLRKSHAGGHRQVAR